ncbi:hypothetical protein RHMOL_Rhmol06G0064600 [Rhododendron molle]|uniref:Uncharacterized protein n=1 Tax=Rhododendron molle TaxID=49168 RepID=A0ACC0NBI1_RHOML|nr:hypothetical protein RHMOL_Rhmol06G0064600 [Rhododendron molle]
MALISLSSFHQDQLLYPFDHAIHSFSIKLTPSQLSGIEKHPAHRANKSPLAKLFTTHTTELLGLKRKSGIWHSSSFGKDIIIARFLGTVLLQNFGEQYQHPLLLSKDQAIADGVDIMTSSLGYPENLGSQQWVLALFIEVL